MTIAELRAALADRPDDSLVGLQFVDPDGDPHTQWVDLEVVDDPDCKPNPHYADIIIRRKPDPERS